MEDREIKKDIKLFNECIDRLKEIGNHNLSLFTNNLQQGNTNTIKFLFNKYIKRNKELLNENNELKAVILKNQDLYEKVCNENKELEDKIRERLEAVEKIEQNCKEGVYYNPKGVLGDTYCTFVSEIENLLGKEK